MLPPLGALKMREVPLFSCVLYQDCHNIRLVDINTFTIVHCHRFEKATLAVSRHRKQRSPVELYFVVVGPSSVALEQLSMTSSCAQVIYVPF